MLSGIINSSERCLVQGRGKFRVFLKIPSFDIKGSLSNDDDDAEDDA